jgi:hypothetical protein
MRQPWMEELDSLPAEHPFLEQAILVPTLLRLDYELAMKKMVDHLFHTEYGWSLKPQDAGNLLSYFPQQLKQPTRQHGAAHPELQSLHLFSGHERNALAYLELQTPPGTLTKEEQAVITLIPHILTRVDGLMQMYNPIMNRNARKYVEIMTKHSQGTLEYLTTQAETPQEKQSFRLGKELLKYYTIEMTRNQ